MHNNVGSSTLWFIDDRRLGRKEPTLLCNQVESDPKSPGHVHLNTGGFCGCTISVAYVGAVTDSYLAGELLIVCSQADTNDSRSVVLRKL